MEDFKRALSDQNLNLIPDYENKIEVLKELGYINENNTLFTLTLKGRVACEVSSYCIFKFIYQITIRLINFIIYR